MGAWCLTGMDSARQKDDFFVLESQAAVSIRKHIWVRAFFIFVLHSVFRANSDDLHFSALQTITKAFPVEEDVRLV